MVDTAESFEGWAIVELMGHRKLAGYCSAVDGFGTAMLRVDIYGPKPEPGAKDIPRATQLYNGSAIYCLTPTTEDLARRVAVACSVAPVTRWELPPPRDELRKCAECGKNDALESSAFCVGCHAAALTNDVADDDDEF